MYNNYYYIRYVDGRTKHRTGKLCCVNEVLFVLISQLLTQVVSTVVLISDSIYLILFPFHVFNFYSDFRQSRGLMGGGGW